MSGPQWGADWSQPGEPVDPNVGAPPPYAYPAPPPYPYYGYPPPVSRPSNVVGASVLAYIAAGLLLLAALLLFLGASIVNSLHDATTSDGFGTELAVDGALDVILAGLLIAGGVLLTNRQFTGRLLITISAVLCRGRRHLLGCPHTVRRYRVLRRAVRVASGHRRGAGLDAVGVPMAGQRAARRIWLARSGLDR